MAPEKEINAQRLRGVIAGSFASGKSMALPRGNAWMWARPGRDGRAGQTGEPGGRK